MSDTLSYVVKWSGDPLTCTILQAINPNRMALGKRETPEERAARKELEKNSLPFENLRRLFRDNFLAQWQVTNLYPWFEEFAPGYEITNATGIQNAVTITFADPKHLLLFKLTWV